MMPKSIATMVPAASTKKLPWCMSAWKKPSRSAWRRNACISRRASAGRSWPAALRPATSDRRMPSTHSSVSTSRAVSSHSTPGTRKPSSAAVSSAISESAAASSRRSISIATERASVSTTATGLRRRAAGSSFSTSAGAGEERFEVAAETVAHAGAQHLDRDGPAASPASDRLVDLRDRGGGDRRGERGEQRFNGLAERRGRRWRATPRPGTGRSRRAVSPSVSAASAPTRSGRVARNCPSLMYDGPRLLSATVSFSARADSSRFRGPRRRRSRTAARGPAGSCSASIRSKCTGACKPVAGAGEAKERGDVRHRRAPQTFQPE